MCLKVAGGKWGGVGGHKFFVTYLGSVVGGKQLEKINSDIKILVTQMKVYPPLTPLPPSPSPPDNK